MDHKYLIFLGKHYKKHCYPLNSDFRHFRTTPKQTIKFIYYVMYTPFSTEVYFFYIFILTQIPLNHQEGRGYSMWQ